MTLSSTTFHLNDDDDYIGTESCIDLQSKNDVVDHHRDTYSKSKKSITNTKKKEKREFPPPIPLLAQTENLASHMPWVLKRYYTSEGRLILKEEKVKHHEYFRVHRANGRLTLQLVQLDHDIDDNLLDTSEEELASPISPHEEINNVTSDHQGFINDRFGDEEHKVSNEENDNEIAVVANGRIKCLNYNSVISSSPSFNFGMPLHPIRTVRS